MGGMEKEILSFFDYDTLLSFIFLEENSGDGDGDRDVN